MGIEIEYPPDTLVRGDILFRDTDRHSWAIVLLLYFIASIDQALVYGAEQL